MRRRDLSAAGFSLVEVLFALGILAFLMVGMASSQGASINNATYVMDLTTSTQLIEGVVLDLEEEYRLDGFPTNQVEGRECELPRGFEGFECEYDLLMLELGADNLAGLGAEANENVASSPLMSAFCTGGASGHDPVDPAIAIANLASLPGGIPPDLQVFLSLTETGFSEICGVNLSRMCSNTQTITMFIPMIIEQAAASTRKLVVRVFWGEEGHADTTLQIETFITAVPEAEDQQ